MDWDQLICHLSRISRMPSTVLEVMDHRLVQGTTYIYQEIQTQELKVTVISATRINVLLDSKALSSRVLEIFLLQITKCLDSTTDIKKMTVEY